MAASPQRVWRFLRCATAFALGLAGRPHARSTESPAPPALVAASDYAVDFWRESDGLAQSRVRQIVQTHDGYLWLGTVGGLVRFDGARFVPFDVQTGSLRDNEVWALREDRSGGLWIGTVGGGLTCYRDGEFTTYTKADGLPDDVIRHLDFDAGGALWIATLNGIARQEGASFRTYDHRHGLLHDSVTRMSASSAEGVFVVSGDRLHRFDGDKFVLVENVLQPSDGRPLALTSGRDGALWIACEGGVAKRLHRGEAATFPLENHLGARNALIYQDHAGVVWMGARDGLRRLENGVFRLFSPTGTSGRLGAIMGFCEDREGSLWIGLETNGLARLRRAHFSTLTDEAGLTEVSMRSVYQDGAGDIWMGTASGIARWRDGKITNYTTLDGAPLAWVNSFAEDAAGTLWIAAAGELLLMRGETLVRKPGWKRTSDIKSILRDPQDRMWVTTDGDGLFCFTGDRVATYRTTDGLPSNFLRGLVVDRAGALWIATFGAGLARFADGKFTTFTAEDGLGSNRVVSLLRARDDALWISTRSGVTRYKDGKFHNFSARDGLPVNFVSTILEDDGGHLWFSSDQGIFQVRAGEFEDVVRGRLPRLKPTLYGVKDGMRSAGFMAGQQPSGWKTRDGRLLFPSLRGLVIVDPARITSNTVVPPVHIEQVSINDRPRPLGEHPEIPPGEGKLQVDYTALSFLAAEKVRFRYRLDGFDKDWVEAGTRRFAYYGNLPPGRYTFRVIACNNDGIWNDTGDSFSFQLEPHFYQSLWFYLLCVAGLVGLIGAGYELRVRRLVKHEAELKQRVDEALAKVKVLADLLPICASCKQVRDDQGYWNEIEVYIRKHSDTQISHGICPDCVKKLYPDIADDVLRRSPTVQVVRPEDRRE